QKRRAVPTPQTAEVRPHESTKKPRLPPTLLLTFPPPPPPYQSARRWAVSREIENHYPTMTAEAICALSIVNLATPDAMLFLWAPAPLLTDALNIMTAWGFEYATSAVWVKDTLAMGAYLRHHTELFL